MNGGQCSLRMNSSNKPNYNSTQVQHFASVLRFSLKGNVPPYFKFAENTVPQKIRGHAHKVSISSGATVPWAHSFRDKADAIMSSNDFRCLCKLWADFRLRRSPSRK